MGRFVVLVAEDDPGVRMTLEFVLEDEGFEVVSAADGEEALRLAFEHRPHAILLDQLMPKKNGREVLETLRADADTESTPVFVLSGMDPKLDVALGGDGAAQWEGAHFLGKPFDPEELVAAIRHALEGSDSV